MKQYEQSVDLWQ